MLTVILTSDYEIHGNGDGSPLELMVRSTDLMLGLFERYGAQLTIMADVAEIQRFGRHRAETGCDDFAFASIVSQLRSAIVRGHDVQLHVHPSYYDARWRNGRWEQDYGACDLAPRG